MSKIFRNFTVDFKNIYDIMAEQDFIVSVSKQRCVSDASFLRDFESFKSLDSVLRHFTTQKICKEWLAKVRWRGEVRCPICGGIITYKCSKGFWHCEECNRNFTATVGTIFESTKLPLRKWFAAIWLTINNKKGVSSSMLSRELGVTQCTAWHMLQKLRLLVPQPDEPLEGGVQVDCGYVGGNLRWVNGKKPAGEYLRNKVALLGMVNGCGYRIRVVDEGNWKNIRPVLEKYVHPDAVVYTDMGNEFKKIDRELSLEHYTVNHEIKQWKDHLTGASTSAAESCWAHIRRHHKGIYHVFTKKYSQRYVDEFVYRYNTLGYNYKERACDFFSSIFLTITWRELRL